MGPFPVSVGLQFGNNYANAIDTTPDFFYFNYVPFKYNRIFILSDMTMPTSCQKIYKKYECLIKEWNNNV